MATKKKKIRQFLNQNSTISTIAAVALLVAALGAIVVQLREEEYEYEPVPVWYYDLNTGELFVAKSDRIPPIEAPSGRLPSGMPAGVRAHVFSCGDCENPDERFLGFLEMYTKEVRDQLTNPEQPDQGPDSEPITQMRIEEGHLIRSAPKKGKTGGLGPQSRGDDEDAKWVPMESQQGYKIQRQVQERCGDKEDVYPEPCRPDAGGGDA